MISQARPERLIVNLQVCRGLAAFLVVIGHALQDSDAIAARLGIAPVHSTVNWACGVDIFFVISGFIMVHVAGDEFGRGGAPVRFLAKRLARIVPLYWLMTSVLILGSLARPDLLNVPIGGAWHIASSYLFIPDWRPDMTAMRPVMALGWSLNYEMLFYVLFAIAMMLPLRRGILVLAATFVAGVALRLSLDIQQSQLAFWTDPIVFEFLFGVFIALAWRRGWRLTAPVAMAAVAVGFAGVAELLPLPVALAGVPDVVRHGLPAALLVAGASLGPGLPANRLVVFGVALGNASYALYLCHPFVMRPLREVWLKLGLATLPLPVYCLFCAIGAVGAALVLHRFIEKPMTRAVQKRALALVGVQKAAMAVPPQNRRKPLQTA